ncbi:hypothetical protein J5Y04_31620 [Kitasatospora sp. RG8]|uniref:hypothetical protein n=1 Tax=Kitasatospora sp. RG8 TaxID=2820815 RepID=UPI001AE00555|nr:hypothetical protein [Kitasatospora sp. RG8]MBP0454057.1 hypothetical protein [Kitasatospora sp. RG8]
MSADEVTAAMSALTGDTEHRTWTSGPGDDTWKVCEGRYREFGLHLYYRNERLSGVAVDALCGPQVTVEGTALVGRTPSEVGQWMEERDAEVSYMSLGVPRSDLLGVVVNVQRAHDRLLTRPVFFPAEALDDLPHWFPQRAWEIHG